MEIKDMSQEEKEQRIKEILEAFRNFDGKYKREEVDDAIELKEEITPYLIKILEDVLANPSQYIENADLFDHIYSLMLLGHFKEVRAHKVIVDIFSFPDEKLDDLFGDIATSTLPAVLVNTCGGNLDLIKTMIPNPEVDDYCRVASCEALTYAILEGYISRKDAVLYLGNFFTGNETEDTSDFWGLLAFTVAFAYPIEIMDKINQAYDEDLIAKGLTPPEEIKEAINWGEEKCLEQLAKNYEKNNLADIHKKMSWWHCFREKTESTTDADLTSFPPFYPRDPTPAPIDHKALKKKAQAKKNKKKQAKASKKKNRGKKKKK